MSLLIVSIIFLGAFTQSLTGFGMALVAMSLLSSLIGLNVASPLVAATSLALEILLLIRYRQSFKAEAIWRPLAASLIGAPLGVFFLSRVDERPALFILGTVIALYALYALAGFRLPEMNHPLWAWTMGFISGALGGAYNTSGPPIVIYGNCRGWNAGEFKSALSGFFVINSMTVTASHFFSGHFASDMTRHLPYALASMFAGFIAGQFLDRWISPDAFRKIVVILLIALGIRLMI